MQTLEIRVEQKRNRCWKVEWKWLSLIVQQIFLDLVKMNRQKKAKKPRKYIMVNSKCSESSRFH